MSDGQTVTPQDARAFVTDFAPDPKGVATMPDDQVLAYHGRVTESLTKHGPKHVAFGDGWRKSMAGEDEKELKQAERYASPAEVWKKARALEMRLTSGELRSVPPKDAKPEQMTAWRTENGIPEAPEKYELKLRDGLVVGAEDKPVIDAFLKSAHGANYTPQQASAAVDWYYDEMTRQTEARAAQDQETAKKTEDALRLEWGADYRRNDTMILGLLDGAPAGVKDQILSGRLGDGTPIMASVEAKKWLAQLAREVNPGSTVVPNAGANVGTAIADEIAAITKQIGNKQSDYWKGEKNAQGETKLQVRLRELNDAQAQMEARGRKAA